MGGGGSSFTPTEMGTEQVLTMLKGRGAQKVLL